MIFILGSPRSGTTWLGKIFDSHPDVIYRHEPDVVCRSESIPTICRDEDIQTYLSHARIYLDRLTRIRHPRVMGTRPIFRKSFAAGLAHYMRYGLVRAGGIPQRLKLSSALINQIAIPDFAGRDLQKAREIVIKSVHALGRVKLYQRAAPESRTILIVRHPCGHAASYTRGLAAGLMLERTPVTENLDLLRQLAEMENAQRRGLDLVALKAMTPIQRLTWRWVLMNEKALEDAKGKALTRVLRYEDLCARPVETAKDLFAFAGLSWNGQTAGFLSGSTSHRGVAAYYSVLRDTKEEADKWKRQMSVADIEAVLAIAASTEPGRLFTEGAQPA